MDRHPKRHIEQLQIIQLRQRRVIQQLQAENVRLLSDIADIRQERDAYRGKAALARRETVELQNRLEEALTEYQDLKRGRATVVRFVSSPADTRRRSTQLGSKPLNMLSVVNENPAEETDTTTSTGTLSRPKMRPRPNKQLPIPPKPRPDHHPPSIAVSNPVVNRETF